jgi:hypothetical protein
VHSFIAAGYVIIRKKLIGLIQLQSNHDEHEISTLGEKELRTAQVATFLGEKPVWNMFKCSNQLQYGLV